MLCDATSTSIYGKLKSLHDNWNGGTHQAGYIQDESNEIKDIDSNLGITIDPNDYKISLMIL